MPTAVALRPRAFAELFDAAFQLTREHFAPLAVLSALMALPGLVLNVASVLVFGDPRTFGQRGTPGGYYPSVVGFGLLTACWFFVLFGAMVSAASDAYMGARVDAGESLRRAWARRGALVGANVLAYLYALGPAAVIAIAMAAVTRQVGGRNATAAGLAAALLGLSMLVAAVWGIITLLRYSVVSPVVVNEESGAADAVRRARALSSGSLKRIFGVFFILFVVILVLGGSVTLVGEAFLRHPIVLELLSGLVSIPLYAVIAPVTTVLYYDLRIRRDGFDVEYAARQLGGGDDVVGSPAVAH